MNKVDQTERRVVSECHAGGAFPFYGGWVCVVCREWCSVRWASR